MTAPSAQPWPAEIPGRWPVTGSRLLGEGHIVTFRQDTVRMPAGHEVSREYIEHPGAVAIVALDDAGRVLMIRQYRHPAGWELWEIPAGLCDVAGEPPLETARRELAEEAGYRAAHWRQLGDFFTSPGISDERVITYLATGLEPVPAAELTHERADEEAHLVLAWEALATVVSRILSGELRNGVMATGVLAAFAAAAEDRAG